MKNKKANYYIQKYRIEVKCKNALYYNSEASAQIILVADQYSQSTLHGPASCLKGKSLIYPCDQFRCRIGCPCKMCGKKVHCSQAGTKNTCGDCPDCREDYEDHLLYHRAYHTLCKFCINVHEHLPNYSYIVRQTKGCFPAFYDHYVSASSFYVAISAYKGHSDSYPCDKCDLNFPNKADLKRHEISLHFGEKHKCCICGLKYSRKDSLSQHRVPV